MSTTSNSPLPVAFVLGGLYTEGSGIARIVSELASALVQQGTRVDVLTALCGGGHAADHMLDPRVELRALPGWGPRRLGISSALKRHLLVEGDRYGVFHNHSMWMLPNHYAALAARRHGRPSLFTAHGFLEPWALARARWKKRLAAAWFQERDLRAADCIHVNSMREMSSVRAFGLEQPVAVVPNGVTRALLNGGPGPQAFYEAYPDLEERRLCLFLSRLHEKKGVLNLLHAWHAVRDSHPEWHLVVAGPDDGLADRVRSLADELELSEACTLTGPLWGDLKLSAYAAAEFFTLPSYSEGFSMAILEALGSGLPVLCTPGCNFGEIEREAVGHLVAPETPSVAEGLATMMSASPAELHEMGGRARALVERSYTWDRVAEQMSELYSWLREGGSSPSFVHDC